MNITIQGVDITLTPDQIKLINNKLNEPVKPTPEQRFLTLIQGLTLRIDFDNYPNSIFFFKDNEIYFEYDTKDGYLWCRYSYVWKIFVDEYGMSYNDVRQLIKGLVEKNFKMQGVTPPPLAPSAATTVEEHFKLKGVTPRFVDKCFLARWIIISK